MNVTAANNQGDGIYVLNVDGALLMNVAVVNNGGDGLDLFNTTATQVHNLATTHNNFNIRADTVDVRFTGHVAMGNAGTADCFTFDATGIASDCSMNGQSSATATRSENAAAGFVGKIDADDQVNTSDNQGTAVASTITDATRFAFPHRSWGRDGSAFPNADNQGVCSGSDTCRIWDWSARTPESLLRDVNPLPTGDDDVTVGTTTFLLAAVEIVGDGIGDDDLLCESNEHCWYTRNYGVYQGHGAIVQETFTSGALTGISLQRHESNGYFVGL